MSATYTVMPTCRVWLSLFSAYPLLGAYVLTMHLHLEAHVLNNQSLQYNSTKHIRRLVEDETNLLISNFDLDECRVLLIHFWEILS